MEGDINHTQTTQDAGPLLISNSQSYFMSFLREMKSISLTDDGGVIKYLPQDDSLERELRSKNEPEFKSEMSDDEFIPRDGANVNIRLERRLETGELLEKGRNRKENIKVKLNYSNHVRGIHIAIASMRLNEKCWFKISSKYREGDSITSDVYYLIDLCYVKNIKKQLENHDFEGRIKQLKEKKEKGNKAFRENRFSDATKQYLNGIQIIEQFPKVLRESLNESQKEEVKKWKIILKSNAIVSSLKEENFNNVIKIAEEVLDLDPENPKALFLKGKALLGQGNYDEAIGSFQACSKLKNISEQTKNECEDMISQVKKIKAINQSNSDKVFKKIFEKMVKEEEEEEKKLRLNKLIERKLERMPPKETKPNGP